MKNIAHPLQKVRNSLLLLACLLVLAIGAAGGSPALADTPPDHAVVARVDYRSRANLETLAAELDIWEVHHEQGYLIALLQPEDFARLSEAGYAIRIDRVRTAELHTPRTRLPGQINGIPGYLCYRTVEETYTAMQTLVTNYPSLVSLHDIGNSWEKLQIGGTPGYDIYALELTNQNIPGPKPAFFLLAEVHAREYTTAETAMRFAEDLLAKYNTDADATWLLDHYEVHIVPMANPDGRKRAETGLSWRKNTNNTQCGPGGSSFGVDLNRNSSFHWGGPGASTDPCDDTYRGLTAASEPEVNAIQNYVANLFPDQRGGLITDPAPADATGVFISLHSYSGLVLWPWGDSYTPAPNSAGLQTLGRKFAYFNGYDPGQSVSLYPTSGATDDWTYGELGVAAYTFEMGTAFFQSCTTFENTIYPNNLKALYYAFKAARRPYQDPAGPETYNLTVAMGADQLATIQAVASDTRYGGSGEATQNVVAARYSLDSLSWQDGATLNPMAAADGSFNSKTETIRASLDTTCLAPGRHTVYIEGQDAAGNWGVPSAVFLQVPAAGEVQWVPAEQTLFGEPGETLTYTLQAANPGNVSGTYTVTLQNEGWPAVISPTVSTLSLAACDSQPFTVTVSVPATALPGSSNHITLTLMSHSDAGVQVSASIVSRVPEEAPTDTPTVTATATQTPTATATITPTPPVQVCKIFLPLVRR
ncbi:MAG: M14 family zinc carboxypeptidase [Chloroflexota bacterium]